MFCFSFRAVRLIWLFALLFSYKKLYGFVLILVVHTTIALIHTKYEQLTTIMFTSDSLVKELKYLNR